MKCRTGLFLSSALILLATALFMTGSASAKYLPDGATQNASGGWDPPTDGYCAGHPEITSFPDCKTVTYPSYATSSTCTDPATGGANRAWMNVCNASDGTPISLKGLDRTAQMCTQNGGTWTAGCVGKWTFGGYYPTYANIDCLRCHNGKAQYSQYADEDNKQSYLKTGHKNTLRKVQPQSGPAGSTNASGTPNYTFGDPWAGPDAAGNLQIYTTDGTDTVNFSDASVTIAGGPDAGQRNLYWIYGGWISALPRLFYGTDAYNRARPTFGTNSGYPCANCHATGFQDDANPGVAGIAPSPGTPAEPLASFPGLSPVTPANARWDLYGIQCSLCHYAADSGFGLFSDAYPTQQPVSSGMGALMLRDHAIRINLCFGCHQSTAGTGVSPTPGVPGGDPAKIPTGVSQGTAYGRDFNGSGCGDAIGNSFLNSVHGQFNGLTTTGAGTMIMNPVGTYDLYDPTPGPFTPSGGMATKMDYGSTFTSYDCWMMPGYGYHSLSTNADGSKITTSAQCATAGGGWVAEEEGTCTTCHDVHQSFAVADAEPIKRKCEDCHTAGGNQSTVGAPTVDVSQMLHPTSYGTPFDTTKYASSCVVCHMATQAVANGDQVSLNMHVWRINTSASYNTFPTMAQFYGGSCSVHGGAVSTNNAFVKVYASDTSSANCTTAGGAWTATSRYRLATTAADGGYAKAVWVDLDLACGQCHGGSGGFNATHNGAPFMTKSYLAVVAKGMHMQSPPPTAVITSATATGKAVAVVDGSTDATSTTVNWGDGSTTTQTSDTTFNHTYKVTGTYPVTLTARNDAGMYDTAGTSVSVKPVQYRISGTVTYVGTLPNGNPWTVELCTGAGEVAGTNCTVRKGAMIYIQRVSTGTTAWYQRNVGVEDSSTAPYGPSSLLNSGNKFTVGATRTNFTCTSSPVTLTGDTTVNITCTKN